MEQRKQTAVEWLTKRCNDSLDKEPDNPTQQEIGYSKALVHFIILLEEAKQMEKEEHGRIANKAHEEGWKEGKYGASRW